MARQREIEMRDLYAFSRRLAVAFDVADIQSAIEDHLTAVMQRKVVLFCRRARRRRRQQTAQRRRGAA